MADNCSSFIWTSLNFSPNLSQPRGETNNSVFSIIKWWECGHWIIWMLLDRDTFLAALTRTKEAVLNKNQYGEQFLVTQYSEAEFPHDVPELKCGIGDDCHHKTSWLYLRSYAETFEIVLHVCMWNISNICTKFTLTAVHRNEILLASYSETFLLPPLKDLSAPQVMVSAACRLNHKLVNLPSLVSEIMW